MLAGLAFSTARLPEMIFEDVFKPIGYLEIGDAKLHESPFLDDLATSLEQYHDPDEPDELDTKLLGVTMRPLIRKARILSRIQTRIVETVGDNSGFLDNITPYITAKYQTIQEALDTLSDLKKQPNIPSIWDLKQLGSALTMSLAHVEAEQYITRRYIPHEDGKMHLDIRTESEERLLQIEADLKKDDRSIGPTWNAGSPVERLLRKKSNQLKSELDHFTKIKVDLLNKKATLEADTE